MTRLDTRIVTALLARDSKDATYKFALLRAIVQCVTEQRAHKRIDENPFAREKGVGEGQGALSTRETPSTRNPIAPDDETSRKRIHPDVGFASKPILPNAPYLNIDHVLPYSLWQNNNLWNLLPVSAPVNNKKRDRIPTPGLIDRSAGRIREVWGLYAGSYGSQFFREMYEGLAVSAGVSGMDRGPAGAGRAREAGVDGAGRGDAEFRDAGRNEIGRGDEFNPAIGSLKQISAYLIDKRGFPEFDL